MPVVETEVFPVRVEMVCDTCGVGKVRYTGNTKTFGDDVRQRLVRCVLDLLSAVPTH